MKNFGQTGTAGLLQLGKAYTAPIADNHATPKKYVDNLLSGVSNRIELEILLKNDYPMYYVEPVSENSAGFVTQQKIWNTFTKSILLFTIDYSYDVDNYLIQTDITDAITGNVLRELITYNNKKLTSITVNYIEA